MVGVKPGCVQFPDLEAMLAQVRGEGDSGGVGLQWCQMGWAGL